MHDIILNIEYILQFNPCFLIELFMLEIHRQNRHIFRDKCMRMPPSLTISSSTRALVLSPGYSSIAKTMNLLGSKTWRFVIYNLQQNSAFIARVLNLQCKVALKLPRRGHYLWGFGLWQKSLANFPMIYFAPVLCDRPQWFGRGWWTSASTPLREHRNLAIKQLIHSKEMNPK